MTFSMQAYDLFQAGRPGLFRTEKQLVSPVKQGVSARETTFSGTESFSFFTRIIINYP